MYKKNPSCRPDPKSATYETRMKQNISGCPLTCQSTPKPCYWSINTMIWAEQSFFHIKKIGIWTSFGLRISVHPPAPNKSLITGGVLGKFLREKKELQRHRIRPTHHQVAIRTFLFSSGLSQPSI